MLTKSDKDWVKEEFVVNNVRIRTEMRRMEDELKEEIRSKHDDVMTVLDKIMKEVARGREHDLVVSHQVERLDKAVFSNKN